MKINNIIATILVMQFDMNRTMLNTNYLRSLKKSKLLYIRGQIATQYFKHQLLKKHFLNL